VGKGKGHIPLRTCISCGKKRNKKALIRLALDQHGQLVRDDLGKKQGRGAYICKSVSCLENLSKHKYLKRVFRSENKITLSPDLKT
jgi:predicted RNA-binding protein YlxR (DUF448 family)